MGPDLNLIVAWFHLSTVLLDTEMISMAPYQGNEAREGSRAQVLQGATEEAEAV